MTGVEKRAEGPWVLVHCWSHLCRRFVKLMRNQGSPNAEEAVRQIALLYGGTAPCGAWLPVSVWLPRRERSAPIVTALKTWFDAQLSQVSKGSQIATDIRYALGLRSGLARFLEDGRLELDTNPVEDKIRPLSPAMRSARKLDAAGLHRRHLQDERREPGCRHRRNSTGDPRRPSTQPQRGPQAMALPQGVKPRRIEPRLRAYGQRHAGSPDCRPWAGFHAQPPVGRLLAARRIRRPPCQTRKSSTP